jgi:sarcosine oxidase subunit alpha
MVLAEGAQLISNPQSTEMIGHVTSSYFGARIGRSFALALVEGGRARHGEPVWAWHLGRTAAAHIASPVFYDPENRRRDS